MLQLKTLPRIAKNKLLQVLRNLHIWKLLQQLENEVLPLSSIHRENLLNK